MAGALTYMAAGAADGFGRGISDIGAQMMTSARQEEQNRLVTERQMQLERMREDSREELLQQRLQAQGALAGARGQGQGMSAAQALDMPDDKLAGVLVSQGMTPEQAQDAVQMMRLKAPQQDMPLQPNRFGSADRIADAQADADANGMPTAKVAKYNQGQAANLLEQSRVSLRRALALSGQTDDVAKAEAGERTGKLVDKFAQGDDRAGDAALMSQGKDPFAAGERADATVKAAEIRAKASTAKAAAGGAGGNNVQSTFVNDKGERVAVMRDKSTVVLGKDGSYQKLIQAEKARLAKTMDNIGASDADLESKAIDNIVSRSTPKADAAPAPKPANAASALSEAKAAIARGADRAKVIARLKSMGIDPQGL